jgi:basic membrane protein A
LMPGRPHLVCVGHFQGRPIERRRTVKSEQSQKKLFAVLRATIVCAVLVALVLVSAMCAPSQPTEAPPPPTEAPAAPTEAVEEAPEAEAEAATLAIEHFSIIEGTTWSGAHDRAGKRIAEKYPNVEYVYREEVGPDAAVPFAEELISEGADIVVGNAEFMGLPLKEIAGKYPDVYFGAVIASDLATEPNFIRFFPRQYQALYLEGLIAGALTETGNIGIVSAFPSVQVGRRQSGFFLGVQDAAEMLGKDVTVYVKYVGDWYLPAEERDIATTLVSQYDVDVLTQQTDSGSPLDVAVEEGVWFVGKDMDIVGFYGWSDTDTVAVSFDTRWEVLYERMVEDWLAGEKSPETVLYLGMDDTMVLADGTELPTVDIMNDNKVGVDAISAKARPLIPDEIVDLVEKRRDEMMNGAWDPFEEHAFVSNGTGFALEGLPVPEAGTEVKPAGEMPTDEWLLSQFNFDLEGMVILD